MKKLALISLISLVICAVPVNAEIVRNSNFYEGNELESQQQEFFESGTVRPVNPQPQDDPANSGDFPGSMLMYAGGGGDGPRAAGMPLFKKYRIKITNHFRTKAYQEAQKLLKEEELRKQIMDEYATEDISDEELEELIDRNLKKVYADENGDEIEVSYFEKFKNLFKRKKADDTAKSGSDKENKEVNSKKDASDTKASEDNLELSGGVKEVVAQNDIVLDCDKMNYDDETEDLEAIGHPVLSFPPQGVTIKADKLVYNTASNIIKAYDNVEIIKDNNPPITGDYIQINMNDETAIVTNMKAHKMNMLIKAKDVSASEDSIVLENGSMQGEGDYILRFRSRMVGPRLEEMMIPEDEFTSAAGKEGLKVKVKADEVYVTAKKDHDVVTVKNADIYLKDNYITRLGSFTAHTNKNHEYIEANYPELGSKPRLGMFIGPGFVFDSPYGGGTFKVIPFLNYKNDMGVGAALKYRSGTNYTEAYYGTAENVFILKGRQFLDDRLYLQYGVNSYLEEWWMGSGMSKYQVQAIYRDSYTIPNTLGNRSAQYRQRISAGYIQDTNYNRKNEHLNTNEMGTTRLKYMAELAQSLYSYKNEEKLIRADLAWILQGSAALYGTGDTQFIGRTGPVLHTQYKRWMQDIGYFISAYDDNTPLPIFDTYRYGRSNVFARESLRLNKYLTFSWITSANLSDDSPNGKVFQENGFYLAIGPDDLKLMLGYDFIREQTIFLFTSAIDMKGTSVDYKKMVIKNPEKLARDDSEKVELVNFDRPKTQKIRRTHAEVIEIEDPNREQL